MAKFLDTSFLDGLELRVPRAARAHAFLSENPFGEKIWPWDSSCPSWMPGYHSRTHGFCRKLTPPKHEWFVPAAPRPGAPTPRPHRHRPQQTRSWETPAQEVRQEQKDFRAEEPQVPFTVPPQPKRRPRLWPPPPPPPPPPVPPAAVGSGGAAPAPAPETPQLPTPPVRRRRGRHRPQPQAPQAPVDVEPRPPLIVEQKTSEASSKAASTSVGIVEDEPTEEQMMPAEAKQLTEKLSKEGVEAMEREEEQAMLPHNAPGTPPEEPSWPPPRTAPPVQPIPPRPGDADYNYGWTPPPQRAAYSPPWPGGAPLTAVDRTEAVLGGVSQELQDVAQGAEDVLVNTTM